MRQMNDAMKAHAEMAMRVARSHAGGLATPALRSAAAAMAMSVDTIMTLAAAETPSQNDARPPVGGVGRCSTGGGGAGGMMYRVSSSAYISAPFGS